MMNDAVFSSFRDPSGFVYEKGGAVFRRINKEYFPHYEA